MSTRIFDGCLLLSDIDGTLVYDGEIPEENLRAIKHFTDNGGLFSIATGRSVEATRPYAVQTGANCGVVVSNGAIIYDYNSEAPIFERHLPDSARPVLTDIVAKFPLVGAEIHDGRKLYLVNRTDATDAHMEYEHIFAEDIPLDEAYRRNWTKLLFACFDGVEMSRLHDYADTLSLEGCYFLKTADIYFELTCDGVNKGAALDILAKHYDIDTDKVFAIGDYYNDAEMLKTAGISAACAGAPDDIKSLADYTACECQQGSVADFIYYLEKRLAQSL